MKKALDMMIEKNFSLLPDPYNIECVACDDDIPDPLERMSKTAGPAVKLGEGKFFCFKPIFWLILGYPKIKFRVPVPP